MTGSRICISVLCLWVLTTVSAHAEEVRATREVDTPVTHAEITDAERKQTLQWQLTDTEWARYRVLQKGVTGFLGDPRLSPIQVLGIHAESEGDRQRYAERWAEMKVEYGRKSLAWYRASVAARERLFGGLPIIDESRLPGLSGLPTTPDFQLGDRLMYFVGPGCSSCPVLLQRLMRTLQRHVGVGLDIYWVADAGVKGAKRAEGPSDERVKAWAREQALPSELVGGKRITLNHDNGLLARLVEAPEVPTVLRRRGDDIGPVAPADIGR